MFETPIIREISLGVSGVMVWKIAESSWKFIEDRRNSIGDFYVSGFWFADFSSYVGGKKIIEIVEFRGGNRLKLRIQHYNNGSRGVRHFRGTGVLRAGALSLIYYDTNRSGIQSGAASLAVLQDAHGAVTLVGHYAELRLGSAHNEITVAEEKYKLYRADLDFGSKLKFWLGAKCFTDFDQAVSCLSVLKEPDGRLRAEGSEPTEDPIPQKTNRVKS